jgi:hypothetical protein
LTRRALDFGRHRRFINRLSRHRRRQTGRRNNERLTLSRRGFRYPDPFRHRRAGANQGR